MSSDKSRTQFLNAIAVVMLLSGTVTAQGCHNTARGVKADTKRALDKTGQKLENAADKIDDKKPAKKD